MSDEMGPAVKQAMRSTVIAANVYEANRQTGRPAIPFSPKSLFNQTHFSLAGLPEAMPVVLLHALPPVALLEHWREALDYKPIVVTCKPKTGWLCTDALDDPDCLSSLAATRPQRFLSWGLSQGSWALEEALGIESGLGPLWSLTRLFNGKIGNRALLCDVQAHHRDIHLLPMAVVDSDWVTLKQSIRDLRQAWPSLIVKPGGTWGGKGTFFVDNTNADSWESLVDQVPSETITGYFVIEPLVGNISSNVSPSYDWMPSPDGGGRVRAGRMIMRGFNCIGTVFGKGSLAIAEPFRDKMESFTSEMADILKKLLYTEWFDVDFLSDGKSVFVNETNIRHTGGTVPLLIADRLLGSKWEQDWTVVSLDALSTSIMDPHQILSCAEGLMTERLGAQGKFVLTSYDVYGNKDALASIWVAGLGYDKVVGTAEMLRAAIS